MKNENASPFVKNQTKGLFLFVSLCRSQCFAFAILCGFFESRSSWGLGPYCATWHRVVCPTLNSPHTQVTGAECRSRLEGRAGSRLACQESDWGDGEIGPQELGLQVPGTPSTVPTVCLQNKSKDEIIEQFKMILGAGSSECVVQLPWSPAKSQSSWEAGASGQV